MSKAKLKKELQTLDKDQLIEVLLSTYSASTGAKEYLEFFLNPDVEALMEKKAKIVNKELSRSKYGYSKARVSVINKAVRDFASFGVGPEYVARFALQVFVEYLRTERWLNFNATLCNATGKMITTALTEAAKGGILEAALTERLRIYREPKTGRDGFKADMPSWIRTAIAQLPENAELPEIDFTN